jgi:hypothetical protein
VSDRGSQFSSDFFVHLCAALKIKQLMSTSFHPETDGQTERVNQVLKTYLRSFVNHQQDNWVNFLGSAEFSVNNAQHSSTGMSPMEALMGFQPRFDAESITVPTALASPAVDRVRAIKDNRARLTANYTDAQRRMKHQADRHRSPAPSYQPGDKVWWRRRHARTGRPSDTLDYKYTGLYEIIKQVGPNAFRLKLPRTVRAHSTINVRELKPYHPNTFTGRSQAPPPPLVINEQIEYEVEEVLDSRIFNGSLQYLVRWRGYGPEGDSWQPRSDLSNAQDACKAFHLRYPDGPSIKTNRATSKQQGTTKRRRP